MEKFNKKVSSCLQNCQIIEKNDKNSNLSQYLFKTEEEYQNSFGDIEEFSKKVKDKDKKNISVVIYHDQNQDGLFSALVFYQYALSKNIDTNNLTFIPMKPASGDKRNKRLDNIIDKIKGKDILLCDIQYSFVNLELLSEFSNKMYYIDDHPRTVEEREELDKIKNLKGNYFIGDDKHAACAYTWKFFFPNKNVPLYIETTDNNDIKLQKPMDESSRSIFSFFNYRMVHNPLKKFTTVESFEKLNDFVENVDKNLFYIVGHYYDELANNIKMQVCQNAVIQNFLGYKVTILNYNDPVLSTMVQRQMITNAEMKNQKVDFAVLWGFEYTSNAYRISMSEKHAGSPKYNLPLMAQKLGKFFQSPKGGGGKRFLGNFYLPRGKYDIWDLMTTKKDILKKAKFL